MTVAHLLLEKYNVEEFWENISILWDEVEVVERVAGGCLYTYSDGSRLKTGGNSRATFTIKAV